MKKCSTIGEMLKKLAQTEEASEKADILSKLNETVTGNNDEQFLRMCISAAERGQFSIDVGKCVPPYLEDEGISYENSKCGGIVVNW